MYTLHRPVPYYLLPYSVISSGRLRYCKGSDGPGRLGVGAGKRVSGHTLSHSYLHVGMHLHLNHVRSGQHHHDGAILAAATADE